MEVEWLILADAAQVVGNKLYLLGGGWDRLTVNSGFPVNRPCAVALSVKIPWNETNQKHSVEVSVVAEDSVTEVPKTLVKVPGQFEVGRPPGIPPGQDQRIQLAINMNLKLETSGTFRIIARIEDQDLRETHFNVVPGPILSARSQEGPAT